MVSMRTVEKSQRNANAAGAAPAEWGGAIALVLDIDHALQAMRAAQHAGRAAREVEAGRRGAALVLAVLVAHIHLHPFLSLSASGSLLSWAPGHPRQPSKM